MLWNELIPVIIELNGNTYNGFLTKPYSAGNIWHLSANENVMERKVYSIGVNSLSI